MNQSTSVASGSVAAPTPLTWKDRIKNKIFPFQPCFLKDEDCPFHYEDELVSRIRVDISFLDRLRILVTGKAEIESHTACEHFIGSSRSVSVFRAGRHFK